MLAVSTLHPDPLAAFAELHRESLSPSMPTWISRTFHRTYLLLHPSESTIQPEPLFEQVRRTYNSNGTSYLCQPSTPLIPVDPTSSLQASLTDWVSWFVPNSLVPWLERSIRSAQPLLETRKGLTSRLWSQWTPPTTKRLWSTRTSSLSLSSSAAKTALGAAVSRVSSVKSPSPSSFSISSGTESPTKISTEERWIPPDVPVVQVRRVADWAFALHDYTLAQLGYEQASREFGQIGVGKLYTAAALVGVGITRLVSEQERRLTSTIRSTPLVQSDASTIPLVQEMLGTLEEQGTNLLLRAVARTNPLLIQLGFDRLASSDLESTAILLGSSEASVAGAFWEQAALLRLNQTDSHVPSLKVPARKKAGFNWILSARAYRLAGNNLVAQRNFGAAYQVGSLATWG